MEGCVWVDALEAVHDCAADAEAFGDDGVEVGEVFQDVQWDGVGVLCGRGVEFVG